MPHALGNSSVSRGGYYWIAGVRDMSPDEVPMVVKGRIVVIACRDNKAPLVAQRADQRRQPESRSKMLSLPKLRL